MIRSVSLKYARRSLLRHTRRTILSIIGVGIGCAIALVTASWIRGGAEMQIRAVAESGAGHLRIVPQEWRENREDSLRLVNWQQSLKEVDSLAGVRSMVMRARTKGMLAFGNRMAGVEIMGVEPDKEKAFNRIVNKGEITGRYLLPDDVNKVVIGKELAKRLDVEPDDDLYVTLVGRDGIESAMLRIIGIIDTGSGELDAAVCHVRLSDIEKLTGYTGPAEISVLLYDYKRIESARKLLSEKITDNEVITWMEVNPAFAANIKGDTAFTRVLVGMIVLVVCLGIASAQLTAVMERRREFAILSAIGMKGRQIIVMVVLEALFIGLGGALVALMLGGSLAHYLATTGVNLEAMIGGEFSVPDVLLDPYIYGDFGYWLIGYALGISICATLFASIYPAWKATRVDPAKAMRT